MNSGRTIWEGVTTLPDSEEYRRNNFVWGDSAFVEVPTLIFYDGSFRFDTSMNLMLATAAAIIVAATATATAAEE